MSKKKILIIGYYGGLAQEINYQLKNLYNLKFLSRQQVDAFTAYKKYFNIIKKFKPSYVVNAIAVNGIKNCERNLEKAYFVNGYLPKIIYSYSKKFGFKFIHFSSATVLNTGVFKKSYLDQSKPKPFTVYGKSKHKSEAFLLNKKKVIIIRLPMLFGPRQKKNLIHKLLINLKKNKKTYAATDVYTTPVYTPNLVLFINKKIFQKDVLFTNKLKNNLINFSSSKYISIFALMKIFAKYLKKEKYLIPVKNTFFDKNSTIPKYLGLQSKKIYSMNMTLKLCVKDYLNQMN